ncbi:BON domain-containing protein [Bdellovibrio sp. SKB1291214]|uniref:BON domain-containing protein n=1 Tax=Bdellovibrio sp. SKB1291214 TaxID=1732569 RepID=UPI000B51855B|nr:BON domain-containing protein [Bdellovibrio sp. SKB1291214]UYL10240.1 BON domain-containing protein [Bdellovibrio sp. SKB1291214]
MQRSNYHAPRRRDREMAAIQRERREIQFSPEEEQLREQKFLNRAEARHRYNQHARSEKEYHQRSMDSSKENNYPSSQNDEADFYNYEENREHLRYASPDFNTGYAHDANRPLPRDFVSSSNYEANKRQKNLAEQDWTERDFHPDRQRTDHRNDIKIRDEITHALAQHRDVDARDIDVEVHEGIVTLTGFVPERKMRYLAEDISINCYGAVDVTNHLRVHRNSEAEARFGGRRTFERRP